MDAGVMTLSLNEAHDAAYPLPEVGESVIYREVAGEHGDIDAVIIATRETEGPAELRSRRHAVLRLSNGQIKFNVPLLGASSDGASWGGDPAPGTWRRRG